MKRTGFVSSDEVKGLEEQDKKVKEQIKALPESSQAAIREVDEAFNEITNDVFDFDSENRVRAAGYTPQQAEDIAKLSRSSGVGMMFRHNNKNLVLTPFKTVVDAQLYLSAVQNRLLELTTVPVEVEVANLKSMVKSFTSLSFFGLIKLAFTNLLKGNTRG